MSLCSVLVLVVIMMVTVGCVGIKINLTVDEIAMQADTTYDEDENSPFSLVNRISSESSLNIFFDNKFFDFTTPKGLEKYDDNYFNDNSLLIICFLGGEDSTVEITGITVKGSELFVHMNTSNNSGIHSKYIYKFVSLSKAAVADVSKHSYVIRS